MGALDLQLLESIRHGEILGRSWPIHSNLPSRSIMSMLLLIPAASSEKSGSSTSPEASKQLPRHTVKILAIDYSIYWAKKSVGYDTLCKKNCSESDSPRNQRNKTSLYVVVQCPMQINMNSIPRPRK